MSFKMGSLIGSLGTRLYPAPGCSPTPALEYVLLSLSLSFPSRKRACLDCSMPEHAVCLGPMGSAV